MKDARAARGTRHARGTGAALLAVALATGAAGCSDSDGSPSDAASKAAGVLSSATAEAQKKLDEFKKGTDAKSDVKLGDATEDGDRTTVPVTVTNKEKSTKSYLVLVAFKDSGGNRLDTVALNVDDVGANTSKKSTARSHRSLDGRITADVLRALRH